MAEAIQGGVERSAVITRGPDEDRADPAAAYDRPTGLRVVEVDPMSDDRWDAYVEADPKGLVYHHSLWLDALRAEQMTRPIGLACENRSGEIVGVMPVSMTRGAPFLRSNTLVGRRLSSLPRTPIAGPRRERRCRSRAP